MQCVSFKITVTRLQVIQMYILWTKYFSMISEILTNVLGESLNKLVQLLYIFFTLSYEASSQFSTTLKFSDHIIKRDTTSCFSTISAGYDV